MGTNLLEPNLEASIKNWDEGNGLLARTLRDGKEVSFILGSEKLFGSEWISFEELVDKSLGLVKRRIALKDRCFVSSSIDTGKPLLNTPQPVTSQVPQRDIDPSFLVCNIHQPNHTNDDLFIGHVRDILDNSAILLPPEPRLSKVLVQLSDDLGTAFNKPGGPLLLWHLEDGIIEFLPELDGTSRNLVDRLTQLRTDSENATSLFSIGSLPLTVIYTLSSDNEILDRRACMRLLGNHDTTGEEETIKGHWLSSVELDGPVTSQVWPEIICATES